MLTAKNRKGCKFCCIADGKADNDILYEDNDVVVFEDIRPAAKIHLLAIPKIHIVNCNELTLHHIELLDKLKIGGDIAFKRLLLTSIGPKNLVPIHGFHKPPHNSVHHLHMHIIAGIDYTKHDDVIRIFGSKIKWFLEKMENMENEQMKSAIKGLFSELIRQNVDHQQTQIHECYGKIFRQKVEQFDQTEGKIGLMLQLIQSKAKLGNSAILKESEAITEKRKGLLAELKQSFDSIKSTGFGLKQTAHPSEQSNGFHGFNFGDLGNESSMKRSDLVTPTNGHISNEMSGGQSSFINEEDLNQSINMYNSKIPPRLRYKRSFATMTTPEPNKSPDINDADSSDSDVKRKLLERE